MFLAETYVGHRSDDAVAEKLAASDTDVHHVVLSDTERQRSRVRTETVNQRDVGIVVSRDLGDGDVLETEEGALIVVELAGIEALALSLDEGISPAAALEFGHAVGNRHLDLAVRDGKALIPVADSRERLESIVVNHFPEVSRHYETVSPATFDDSGPEVGHSHSDGSHSSPDHRHGDSDISDHNHSRTGHSHDHGALHVHREIRGIDTDES